MNEHEFLEAIQNEETLSQGALEQLINEYNRDDIEMPDFTVPVELCGKLFSITYDPETLQFNQPVPIEERWCMLMSRWPYLGKLASQNEDTSVFPFSESDYHPFDERSTFNAEYTMIGWLYEALNFLKDETIVNWEFHKFIINDEELTNGQCLERMIEDCKIILTGDDMHEFEKMDAAKDDLFDVMKACFWTLWW